MDDPKFIASYEKSKRRWDRIDRLTRWMRRIPIFGRLAAVFWYSLLDEGIYQTCKPRWGSITSSFLNDGMQPSVWHTWRQVTHDHTDPYTGIYVRGAPKSLAQARKWEAKWAKQRESEVERTD